MIRSLWINALDYLSEVETRYLTLDLGYLMLSSRIAFGEDAFPLQVITSEIDEVLKQFCPNVIGISAVSQNYGQAVRP